MREYGEPGTPYIPSKGHLLRKQYNSFGKQFCKFFFKCLCSLPYKWPLRESPLKGIIQNEENALCSKMLRAILTVEKKNPK